MARTEYEILQELTSKWVPLALEYSGGAPGLTRTYIYAGSEIGHVYANVFFEQEGAVLYANQLRGVDASDERVVAVQRFLRNDLRTAEAQFDEAGVPRPTQYRITYDLVSRQLDMQMSHELLYSNHPTKILEEGSEDWLDGRLEKVFGRTPRDSAE
ncbi:MULTISPECIES: hypothetical protein [Clavibacter]|uniref:DUF600 family protein n=1 Tax=Clavibacter tessellarius TaxID=31965 RepID=A0A154V568_9MICO|nr:MULTISPECIES: hypothetical protein [Clavibacter]KZC96523.1 hypothetical protein AWH51_02155 [Clavibacter michiganensis subsp. tessellarius]MDA3804092.1 hypothetical protein [Clavibacter sp. CT19]